MTRDVPIQCECKKLVGLARSVDPRQGNHLKCYCDDCQSFQHFLGRADAVLDEHGGTQIFQMSQGNVEITAGAEHLACMRLRPGGTSRWYASCCQTAIGNTVGTPNMPFIGVITECMSAPPGTTLEASLGPVKLGLYGKYARNEPVGIPVHQTAPLSFLLGFIGKLARWRLRGDHRRTPFFDAYGQLLVTPKVLSGGELAAVEMSRDAWVGPR